MDPPLHPMCHGVDGEETRTHHLSSHPGLHWARLLSQLLEENWSIGWCPACPEVDEDMEHALFCLRFQEKGNRFRALYEQAPCLPRALGGACSPQREEERREKRRREKRKPHDRAPGGVEDRQVEG